VGVALAVTVGVRVGVRVGAWVGEALGVPVLGVGDVAGVTLVAATGGIESNARDMGKFLEALESPPRGKLGQAISAALVSGIGWDSLPGVTPFWKNGATSAYTGIVIFDPATKRGIYVGSDTEILSDGVGNFAMGEATDPLLTRVSETRIGVQKPAPPG